MPIARPRKSVLKRRVKNRQSDIAATAGTKTTILNTLHTLSSFPADSSLSLNDVLSFTMNKATNTVILGFSGSVDQKLAAATAFQAEFRKRLVSWLVSASSEPVFSVRVGDATITAGGTMEWYVASGDASTWFTEIAKGLGSQYLEVG